MQAHGCLKKWNDERGFGFIEVAGTGEEIFVYILAFPKDVRSSGASGVRVARRAASKPPVTVCSGFTVRRHARAIW